MPDTSSYLWAQWPILQNETFSPKSHFLKENLFAAFLVLVNVFRIKVSLLLLDICCFFHIDNLLQNLSSIVSYTDIDLKGAPNGRPR